jgi:hypothetical protein
MPQWALPAACALIDIGTNVSSIDAAQHALDTLAAPIGFLPVNTPWKQGATVREYTPRATGALDCVPWCVDVGRMTLPALSSERTHRRHRPGHSPYRRTSCPA